MKIGEMKPGESVKGYYLCKFKQIFKNKNGKDYCGVKLQDSSGNLDAKIWCLNSSILPFEVDDIVSLEGETILYQDNLQLNINKIQKADSGYDLKDFIPHTKRNVEELEKDLMDLIDMVSNKFVKKLLENVFLDENIYNKFLEQSAGKSVHHAHLNGLLEHTIVVTKLGVNMANLYESANKDMVIAGCLLHDIGKLRELTSFPKNDYSDEGQLIGHIVIGAEIIHDYASKIDEFPSEIELLLKHIILAHHGEYEYASPKRPKCIEAMIVHLSDLADSRLKMFDEFLDTNQDEPYVGYHKLLSRNIRRINL